MKDRNPPSRRKIITTLGAGSLFGFLSATNVAASEKPSIDPIPTALIDGKLHSIIEPPSDSELETVAEKAAEYDGGGPEEISIEDIEEIIAEMNTAKQEGGVTFSQKDEIPHIHVDDVYSPPTSNKRVLGCNVADAEWDTGWLSNSISLYIPSDTVDDLSDLLSVGAGASALIGALVQGGVFAGPPVWVAGAVTAVLVIIGSGISLIDNGCGVELSVTIYTGVPIPVYTISPQ